MKYSLSIILSAVLLASCSSEIETTETNITIANGSYYEQPFSNHITNLKECDFSIDGESVILREGINGVRLNPYTLHDLQANLNTNLYMDT